MKLRRGSQVSGNSYGSCTICKLPTVFYATREHKVHGFSSDPRPGFTLFPACNAFGLVCLSVCFVHALTFESLDLEISFLVRGYIFRISRLTSHIKVIGSRSRSQKEKTSVTHSRVLRLRFKGNLVFIIKTNFDRT